MSEESSTSPNVSISQRLDQQISDLRKQLADFRAESHQRDAELWQEMRALGAMLNRQKTGSDNLTDRPRSGQTSEEQGTPPASSQ